MLRRGRRNSGRGSRCSVCVSWGDGGKYDESAETRAGLISIIWLHFGADSNGFGVLQSHPECAKVRFPVTDL